MTTDEVAARLAAKHKELQEPCPNFWHRAPDETPCWTCHGLGYVPKTGPALLAGLLEACRLLGVDRFKVDWSFDEPPRNIEVLIGGHHKDDNNWDGADGPTLESALTLALARAEGLDKKESA